MSLTSTAHAISEDSDEVWSVNGTWKIGSGIHRIPLPLPMDALRAVNVYVIETPAGLTLIDAGWAIAEAREELERGLRRIGHDLRDITQILVTHAHRDHYTLASVIASEYGATTFLGAEEKPSLDLVQDGGLAGSPFSPHLRECGAPEIAAAWMQIRAETPDPAWWRYPARWLSHDQSLSIGDRTFEAIHTPGHTAGHYVFADVSAGMLFAGDHVLPTITPSIGFTLPIVRTALGDFLESLQKLRTRPDLRVLPAHGPIGASMHARIDQLLEHHEHRLEQTLAQVAPAGSTPLQVAERITWTRHHRRFAELDATDQGMAVMETRAHLDLLAARRGVVRRMSGSAWVYERTAL